MNKKTRHIRTCFIAVFSSLLMVACQDRPKLEPLVEDLKSDMQPEAAKQSVGGVTVLVEGSEWPGYPDVKVHVTPLKVEIRNRGEVPLRVRYSDISLLGPEGNRFAALPTFKVEVTEEGAAAFVDDEDSPYQPQHFAEGFNYVPYYHAVHPAYQPYPYIYSHPDENLEDHLEYWKEIGMPTALMRDVAAPEGSLEPGGTLRGHFFFQKVSSDLDRVTFQMNLFDESTGERFGTVEVPLRVTE